MAANRNLANYLVLASEVIDLGVEPTTTTLQNHYNSQFQSKHLYYTHR